MYLSYFSGYSYCIVIDFVQTCTPDFILKGMLFKQEGLYSGHILVIASSYSISRDTPRHTLPHHPTTGAVFVDRDGKYFRHIISWLRDSAIPALLESVAKVPKKL